jgi:hypothetical protein
VANPSPQVVIVCGLLTEESLRPLDALNTRVMPHPAAARLTLMCRILLAVAHFAAGQLDPMLHTVVWPCGADFAPEFLRSRITTAST